MKDTLAAGEHAVYWMTSTSPATGDRSLMKKELVVIEDECACPECTEACSRMPGWFAPGEVEKVAEFLDVTVDELFEKKLSVDWWETGSFPIYVLSPGIDAKYGRLVGRLKRQDPNGSCVFLKEGRCEIHPVKPLECRASQHQSQSVYVHQHVSTLWDNEKSQQQIDRLLEKTYDRPIRIRRVQ